MFVVLPCVVKRCWPICPIRGSLCVSVVRALGFLQLWLRNRDMCYLSILYRAIVTVLVFEFWKYLPKCCLEGNRFRLRYPPSFVGGCCIGVSCALRACVGSEFDSLCGIFPSGSKASSSILSLFPCVCFRSFAMGCMIRLCLSGISSTCI